MTRTYAGLDVSDKTTHVCVVDETGTIVWRGACATDPEAPAATLKRRCPDVVRVVLEAGPLSAFLYHGLIERGVPAICVCARHAKGGAVHARQQERSARPDRVERGRDLGDRRHRKFARPSNC